MAKISILLHIHKFLPKNLPEKHKESAFFNRNTLSRSFIYSYKYNYLLSNIYCYCIYTWKPLRNHRH